MKGFDKVLLKMKEDHLQRIEGYISGYQKDAAKLKKEIKEIQEKDLTLLL